VGSAHTRKRSALDRFFLRTRYARSFFEAAQWNCSAYSFAGSRKRVKSETLAVVRRRSIWGLNSLTLDACKFWLNFLKKIVGVSNAHDLYLFMKKKNALMRVPL